LNSERRTDNYYRSSSARRRRRKRQIVIMRSIMLIAALLVIVLLVVIIIVNVKKIQITDYYNTENGYDTVLNLNLETDNLTPFADDLAVLCDESNDPAFLPEAGVLATVGHPYITFNKNGTERMNPASTTKIMTALLALKYGKPADQVTITEDAMVNEYGASLANLEPGQTLSLRQLLYGLLLPSGNDAANAIAIHIGGSIEGFTEMMNAEAARLGAVDTHFSNPHGMTEDDHYTTAYDLYLITNEALKYKEFKDICTTKQFIAEFLNPDGLAVSRTWENTNKYIKGTEELPQGFEVEAGKTGTTNAAGNCLVLATTDESGQDNITVVLKADSKDSLYSSTGYLLGKVN